MPPLAIPATKVYVGGLPRDLDCQQLYDLFSTVGHVVECTLLTGYGFVHFGSPEEGQRAMMQLNNYQVAPGFWLHVRPSTTKLCPIPGVYGQEMCYYCLSNEHSYTDCPMYKDEFTEKLAQKKEKAAKFREAKAAGEKRPATDGAKSPEPKKKEGDAEEQPKAGSTAMEVDKAAAATPAEDKDKESAAGGEKAAASPAKKPYGGRGRGTWRGRGGQRGGFDARGKFGAPRGGGYAGGGGRYNLRPGSGPTIKSFGVPHAPPPPFGGAGGYGGHGGPPPLEATLSAAMGYGAPQASPYTYVPPSQSFVPFTGVPPPGFGARF